MESSWGSLGAACDGLLALRLGQPLTPNSGQQASSYAPSLGQLEIRVGRPIFNESKSLTLKQVMKSMGIDQEGCIRDVRLYHKSRLHDLGYKVISLLLRRSVCAHMKIRAERLQTVNSSYL